MTILELADLLQDLLADADFEDLPVMKPSLDGGYTILREDLVRVTEVDGQTVVVIG